MVEGARADQRLGTGRSKARGKRLLLCLALIAAPLVVGGCAASQGNGQASWTLGPTLAPSSAEPSTGTSVAPSETAGAPSSPASS